MTLVRIWSLLLCASAPPSSASPSLARKASSSAGSSWFTRSCRQRAAGQCRLKSAPAKGQRPATGTRRQQGTEARKMHRPTSLFTPNTRDRTHSPSSAVSGLSPGSEANAHSLTVWNKCLLTRGRPFRGCDRSGWVMGPFWLSHLLVGQAGGGEWAAYPRGLGQKKQ